MVVFQSAGHAAAVAQGVCRVFRRVKAGQTPGYPRFKGTARFDSVEWPKDGDGARWRPDTRRVYLQGIGQVKVRVPRAVQGRVKTIQIKRQGRYWMLVLSCDEVPASPLPANGRVAKCETVAARHRKIANQRKDFHHKTARHLVQSYDVVVVEDLAIANMVRRAKPVGDPDNPGQFLANGARAKSGLNRRISDAGWGRFVSILRAKAEDAGRTLIEVDPRHTSDGCEICGHAARENRVTQAVFTCQRCGHSAHADEHAARNILRAGLAHHAHAA